MGTNGEGLKPLSLVKNISLLGILFALALAFFSLVRNNSFWNSGDFLYLNQAMDISESWQHIFTKAPFQPFQPLVKLVFFLEYSLFGLDAWKYYLFNLVVHSLNAFLVYLLVSTLLKDRTIAILSSFLFVCAVGNYGKAVMVVSGISDLLITMLTLLTLLLYFRNELQKGGRVLSVSFGASLFCFVLILLTKATSFGILGCMLAFNIFFRPETKKSIFNREFIIVSIVAFVALVTKLSFVTDISDYKDFGLIGFHFFRNFGSYLVRMVFPIHGSHLVTDAGAAVQFVYHLATEIRLLTFLCILSYSVFGFIFGNRTVRFFIVWTYITVLPFCFFRFPNDWLNIRHLYLVSVGYILLLSYTTVQASRLLYQKAWRRFLPYLLPTFFVFLSQFIIIYLDKNYEETTASPPIEQLKSQIVDRYKSLQDR